ncbi:MAG TPA: aldehyde dehydrogenase family protein [Chloroflexota bacterium]|nr:aldehyde dehydrogenase family protein [Chloroflexota bacterium]
MDAPTYKNLINGQWVAASSGETFEDTNPADKRQVLGRFPSSGEQDVKRAIDAAEAALPGWRGASPLARGTVLLKAAAILESRADEVARDLTLEEGKTLAEAKGETLRGVAILRYFAGQTSEPSGETYPSANPATLLYTSRVPLGIVGLITPWNFPIAIPIWKAAPALAFGNTVVMKPAALTPLTAQHIAECLHEAGLPPGVLNLVHGSGRAVGNPLVADRRVSAISFTGSNGVGSGIAAAVQGRGGRVQCEMGGKNPLVVLEDADLDQAADLTIAGAFRSTGQKCTATSRAIVLQPVLEAFTEKVLARARALKVGPGIESGTWMGPQVSADQQKTVLEYIEIGKREGAELVLGGGAPEHDHFAHGYYVEPTVFTNVRNTMRIAQEEIFGPVLAIIPAADRAEALRLANQVEFGLSASVCTRDLRKALEFVQGIEAGIVHVNGETAGAEPQVPFGGFKASGTFMREQGKAARDFYTQIKTVYLDLPPA